MLKAAIVDLSELIQISPNEYRYLRENVESLHKTYQNLEAERPNPEV